MSVSHRADSLVARPATDTLVIGTARSILQLHHLLQVADPAPRVRGCLTPAASDPSQNLPCPHLGHIDDLENLLAQHPPEQVLVALPLAMTPTIRRVAAALDRLGITWRFMPTLGDQLAGRTTSRVTGSLPGLSTRSGEAIDPAQLIDRKPRPRHEQTIRDCVTAKRVLITGAGGSIGSELARIVSRYEPAKLILVERSENALFEIDRELARVFPDLPRAAVLHDVTQRQRTQRLVDEHQPQVIFHAAAHKHVPMMEDHPAEAVENNFFGTRSIADAAHAASAERFVMISTDKAVNPSSVMGASKRLAELYVQQLNTRSDTTFAMVRFGNVLGSACSVLPIWSDQLSRGGPVTVTHPDMTRYFMTIPEAAGLVIQAAALAEGGEVFLLDMGEPIRIVDLAERFARQQGFEPGVDIQIQFTGPRPGEKLFELLAYDSEDMLATDHESIHRWKTAPPTAARMTRICETFDRLRLGTPPSPHPWQNASRQAVVTALRAQLPEMVTAAAG